MNISALLKAPVLAKIAAAVIVLACLIIGGAFLRPSGRVALAAYNPGSSKTLLLIGQNYTDEFQSYVNATGRVPAGGSTYAELYTGQFNTDSQNLIAYLNTTYPGSYVEVGLSWKDDRVAYGYTNYDTAQIEYDIVNHRWDNSIDTFAQTLKNYSNLKFLVRLDYEVSNNFHANTDPNQWNWATSDWHAYPNAFNYIAQRLRGSDSVHNADFVYHPVRGQAQLMYPGDANVDWIGFSVFNSDVCLPAGTATNCTGQTIDPNLQSDLTWATGRKPVIIAESAVQNPAAASSSGSIDYLGRLLNIVQTYPNVQALTYINSNWTAHGWTDPWGDSRVEMNPSVLSYWMQNVVNQPRFVQATPTNTPTGSVVSLRAHANNNYVTADNGGASPLIASRTAIGPWETFDLISNTDGSVNLRAHANGHYVTADNAGASPLIANRTTIGAWETFDLINNADGSVSLRAHANGNYVTADNAGASPLIANRTTIGAWEEFDLIRDTVAVSLRAHANNDYVTADNAGASPLIANRTTIGAWETFDLISNADGSVSLRAHANNDIVTADNAGASPLIANRTAIGPWEEFDLVENADGSVSLRAHANNDIVTADNAGASPLIANRTAIGPWEEFDLLYD